MKHKLSLLFGLAVLGLLVVGGIHQLFLLRFKSGDVFPHYSSFRSDPKGTKILYDSLVEYPGLDAERLMKPVEDVDVSGQTLLMLGCSHGVIWRYDEVLDPYLNAGGHVVLAYAPVKPSYNRYDDLDACDEEPESDSVSDGEPEKDAEAVEKDDHDPETCWACLRREMRKRWQVDLNQFTRSEMDEETRPLHAYAANHVLSAIPWRSALYFDELGEEWTVLYEYLDKPVVIERKWGLGSVILIADSFMFSNEAMVVDRQTDALVRVLGTPEHILFDELHLGVESSEGVMMLVNRYGLTGVLYAVLLVVGLFVWQRTASFIPKYTDPNDDGNDVGLLVDSHQGFTNLLMRHVPQRELLKTAVQEWRSTFDRQALMKTKREKLDAAFRRMEALDKKLHPVDAYNQLLRILNERK
jgi:hypothetical protein